MEAPSTVMSKVAVPSGQPDVESLGLVPTITTGIPLPLSSMLSIVVPSGGGWGPGPSVRSRGRDDRVPLIVT